MSKTAQFRRMTHLASLILLLTASATAENDRKTYGGIECVELYDTSPDIQLGEIAYNQLGAHNSASTGQWWHCLAVRDRISDTMNIADWDVTVGRGSSPPDPDATWTLTLWSLNKNQSSGYTSTISVPANAETINLDGERIDGAFLLGPLVISSYVPAEGRVFSYSISEELP